MRIQCLIWCEKGKMLCLNVDDVSTRLNSQVENQFHHKETLSL